MRIDRCCHNLKVDLLQFGNIFQNPHPFRPSEEAAERGARAAGPPAWSPPREAPVRGEPPRLTLDPVSLRETYGGEVEVGE